MRRVVGSEAEKETLRFKFVAMRIWGGCSSLCFKLNPHDIRSPLTVILSNAEHFHIERFSLDWDDGTTGDYFARLLGNTLSEIARNGHKGPVGSHALFPLHRAPCD